jgi:hypothetical protein
LGDYLKAEDREKLFHRKGSMVAKKKGKGIIRPSESIPLSFDYRIQTSS